MPDTPAPRYPHDIPPFWLLLAIAAMWALQRWAPLTTWLFAPWTLLGLLPIALGMTLLGAAAVLFRRARTGIRPFTPVTTMVMRGPYRFTRNPMYLGMVLVTFGIAWTMGALTPLLVPPLLTTVLHLRFIRREEEFLTRTLGQPYVDWCRRVRRWL